MTIPSNLTDRVFTVSDLLSSEACAAFILRAQSGSMERATITTQDGTDLHDEIRNNNRLVFDDRELAVSLWSQLASELSQPVKRATATHLNPRFRLYEYTAGQFFDWHQDGSYCDSETVFSQFTLMIYLNDGFEGGGTSFADVFYPRAFQDFTIRPETGKALLFHHPLSHRGDPVVQGTKYVLRTDVMFTSALD